MEKYVHKYGERLRGGFHKQFRVIAERKNGFHDVKDLDRVGLGTLLKEYHSPFGDCAYRALKIFKYLRNGEKELFAEINKPRFAF